MKKYNIFQEPNSWVVHLFDNNITCKCGCDNCRNSFSNVQVKSYKLRKCCETCSLEMTGWFNCYLSTDCNVTGAEKSSLNLDSNLGSLAYHASALVTELLRLGILNDSHTPQPGLPCDIMVCMHTVEYIYQLPHIYLYYDNNCLMQLYLIRGNVQLCCMCKVFKINRKFSFYRTVVCY